MDVRCGEHFELWLGRAARAAGGPARLRGVLLYSRGRAAAPGARVPLCRARRDSRDPIDSARLQYLDDGNSLKFSDSRLHLRAQFALLSLQNSRTSTNGSGTSMRTVLGQSDSVVRLAPCMEVSRFNRTLRCAPAFRLLPDGNVSRDT